MDPFIDPAMAEWLRQKKEALGGAIAADKASQQDEDRRALLMQYAQGYANKRPVSVPARQVNDAQRQFQAETALETGAQGYDLDRVKAFAAMKDKDGGPVPAEWGAPPTITKRDEAIRLGWGPRPPKEPGWEDKPVSPRTQAALVAAGVPRSTINALPNEGEAQKHLMPRGMIPEVVVNLPGGGIGTMPTKGPKKGQIGLATLPDGKPAISHMGAEEEEKDQAHSYGGRFFKASPGTPPDALGAERTKLVRATGSVVALSAKVDELSGLYQQHGAPVTGPIAAQMRTLAKDIQLKAKGEGVYDLGVLNGQDYPLLKSVIDNPNEVQSIVANAALLRDFVSEVQTFKRITLEEMGTVWHSVGYEPVEVEGSPFVKRASSGGGEAVAVKTKEERDALPAGTKYVGPDGKTYTKR